jgi:hypothetical protein
VGGTSYEVTLTGDENLPGAAITPGFQPAAGATAGAATLRRTPAAPAAVMRPAAAPGVPRPAATR